MSTHPSTDLDHLRHLARHAEDAQASRRRQAELDAAASREHAQRIAVARFISVFEDLYGPRTAARLGITFSYYSTLNRPVGRYAADGALRLLYYREAGMEIHAPGGVQPVAIVHYGELPVRLPADPARCAEEQMARADTLILALAGTFTPADAGEEVSMFTFPETIEVMAREVACDGITRSAPFSFTVAPFLPAGSVVIAAAALAHAVGGEPIVQKLYITVVYTALGPAASSAALLPVAFTRSAFWIAVGMSAGYALRADAPLRARATPEAPDGPSPDRESDVCHRRGTPAL